MKSFSTRAMMCDPSQVENSSKFGFRFFISCGLVVLVMFLNTGCGTLKGGRGWGQDAVYPVSWERTKQAANNALFDPVTWVPAIGAGIFAIGNFDRKTSDWAVKYNPVFGSRKSAQDASGTLLTALQAEVAATTLLTPSGDNAVDWGLAKAKGAAVEWGALFATDQMTSLLKNVTHRERPDGSNDDSLPSAGASSAFAASRLTNRNLDSVSMSPWARTSLKTGNLLLASTIGWARVESGEHFPSDVLAGACLGNFVTTFIHDAFMNLPEDSKFSFYLEPSPRGVSLTLSWAF